MEQARSAALRVGSPVALISANEGVVCTVAAGTNGGHGPPRSGLRIAWEPRYLVLPIAREPRYLVLIHI